MTEPGKRSVGSSDAGRPALVEEFALESRSLETLGCLRLAAKRLRGAGWGFAMGSQGAVAGWMLVVAARRFLLPEVGGCFLLRAGLVLLFDFAMVQLGLLADLPSHHQGLNSSFPVQGVEYHSCICLQGGVCQTRD